MESMTTFENSLTGQQFGRLTVVEQAGKDKRGQTQWLCRCSCPDGTEKIVCGGDLRRGHTRSCGCLYREAAITVSTTHGHTSGKQSPEYRVWASMKQRCTNPSRPNYKHYGGRGIRVCERWLNSFENFIADMGPRPAGTSLDRWPNTNGDYEPGNCRWATAKQQQRNTRTNRLLSINQMTLCVADWAELVNTTAQTIHSRLRLGWSPVEAVFGKAALHNI